MATGEQTIWPRTPARRILSIPARYQDPGGRQHEGRFPRRARARRSLDEAALATVTQTWTSPARGRVTVADWAARRLDSQTGIKPSARYRYNTLL